MSFKDVGKVASVTEFINILEKITPPTWAKTITLHHTASPSLAQRPKGFIAQHIVNMRDYYQGLGWKSGPHLYADDDQVWFMSPLTEKGVHAVSFNSTSIGIEVLGDYDEEDPFNGRGLDCWHTAASATRSLAKWLGITPTTDTIKFHRDDPKTSKTCPGTKIKKDWFLSLVNGSSSISSNLIPVPTTKVNVESVAAFVTKNKGYSDADVSKLLKKKGALFFFGDDWLEGAYYDSIKGSTVAPITELQQIVKKS